MKTIILCLVLAVPVAASAETAAQAYVADLQRQVAHADAHRYDRYRPSDQADCRARGNAAFGDIALKYRVMEDCLEARRLRHAGR